MHSIGKGTDERTVAAPQLSRAVGASKFFTLAFGAIVGVGWVVMLGEWLRQAGPLGAILGFVGGGLLMSLVALSYAEMASMFPVSGGEVAYAYEVYGVRTCFATGWFLALTYIAFVSFEAIGVGWIASSLVAGLRRFGFTLAGQRIGADLMLGMAGTVIITAMNLRGIRTATTLQEFLSYGKIAVALVFIMFGILWGSGSNLVPMFQESSSGSKLTGFLAVFATAPVWYAGFNVIPQVMEEKASNTSWRTVGRIFAISIAAAALFYCLVILSASMAVPWRTLLDRELPAAAAFEVAFHSRFAASMVLATALLGLLGTWNAVFIAASRVLFSLGRAQIIHPAFARLHPVHRTPTIAIAFVAVVGALGVLLGRTAIATIVNVGASCFGLVFFLTCLGVVTMRRRSPGHDRPYRVPGGTVTASVAAFVSLLVFCVSIYAPYASASHSIPLEWILFAGWGLLGIVFWTVARRTRNGVSEMERRRYILGDATLD